MKVFRLEKNGVGPYRYRTLYEVEPNSRLEHLLNRLCESHSNNDIHPTWWCDGLKNLDSQRFAFSSLEKLRDWFSGFLERLAKVGFEIVEYEVSDYKTGASGKQITFKLEDALQTA